MANSPSHPTATAATRIDAVVLVLLTLSLGLNLVLGLDKYHRYRQARDAANRAAGLKEGAKVPPFDAERLGAGKERIAFDRGIPTLFYFQASTCGWCQRNLANLQAVSRAVEGRYRLVVISLDDNEDTTRAYAERAGLSVPTYYRPDKKSLRSYLITGTPTTVIVSTTGRVVKSFAGAYTGERRRMMESLLGVTLPGVGGLGE